MTNKQRILIVEDSLPEGAMLVDILEDEGYEVNHALDAELGLKAYREDSYDLILLDVMLPGKDGFQLAKQVKALNQDAPIIFLTARTLKSDEIQGFTLGADDYLTKPYDRELLIWRIKAVLKRHASAEVNLSGIYQIGEYLFDYKNLTLTRNDDLRRITKREADVLQMLCMNASELVKREDLLLSIWGVNDYFNGRSLDVFITKLRKYLKEDPNVVLINVHGVGFELRYPKQ